MRLAPLFLLVSSVALADAPDWTKNAFVFGLDYGLAIWQLNRNQIANQVGAADADVFVNETNTHGNDSIGATAATVRIGFDVLGYVTIEGDLTGTGWNLNSDNRGGGGFLPVTLSVHPLRFFVTGERHLDVSISGGVGYGITGQDRGIDGLVESFGLRGNYFFNNWFSLTVTSRWIFLGCKTFYLDYNHRNQPGASEPLPQGSGGDFWTIGAGLEFRFAP